MTSVAKCRKWGPLGCLGVIEYYRQSPFDKTHMISYCSSMETVHLCCTVFAMRRVTYRNSPTWTYRTRICRTPWDDTVRISERFLGTPKLQFLRDNAALFASSTFSVARAVKTCHKPLFTFQSSHLPSLIINHSQPSVVAVIHVLK